MVQQERIQRLNDNRQHDGDYVLFWMQASQRAEWNHALEYAVEEANQRKRPLIVLFGITSKYPEANLRHYAFMLEGLRETASALRKRGIQLVVRHESPEQAATTMASRAAVVVVDRGYTRIQRRWRKHVALRAPCSVIQVESDVVVPVEVVSGKEEYSAATIRPKLRRWLDKFLKPVPVVPLKHDSLSLKIDSIDISDVDLALAKIDPDSSVPRQRHYIGGTSEAKQRLRAFIEEKLDSYADGRSDPGLAIESHLSPYLHFGQISPLYVALKVLNARGKNPDAKDAFLEQLITRRELSMNFVYYCPYYDSYHSLPRWAQATLSKHSSDHRQYLYRMQTLESANTHDRYWNAAMLEMVITGQMHNYMRMYWGKKILEWSPTPGQGFKVALTLNNKWFLDGRDPNSYAGVAWCFGKHDRPWSERSIFGTVRYMSASGLERKFDMDAYVSRINGMVKGI